GPAEAPACRRGQDAAPPQGDRGGGEQRRGGLPRDVGRRAARRDRRVPPAAGRRRHRRRPARGRLRRRPRGRPPHPRAAPLRRAGDGRRRPAHGQHLRDAHRRGQDPHLRAAGLPERPRGQGRARRDGQRLPRPPRRRVDGARAPLPRAVGRRHPGQRAARGPPRGLRLRHHLRHQQRVRLRLPARQHGVERHRAGAARPPLRDRGRGRLHPHRRGAHAADHQRSLGPGDQVVRRVRPDHPAPGEGRRLRGRREEAHGRDHRVGRGEGRGPARHRQPLRVGQHLAGRLPQQRPQGQGAVPQGQGVRRHERRGAHRRRAHRPRAGGPPLQRGHAPGHRGQGAGGDQEREPDARDDHAPELLP
ncbi:MAG: Protein translocase subunit SecA, partial [uncultured Frankineae bacterium]